MSDETYKPIDVPQPPRRECGWVKLFTPSGALVTLPVTEEAYDYAAMLDNVGAMLNAGFSIQAAGMEPGENKETIGLVARREKSNERGTSGIIDFYIDKDAMEFSFLKTYLNNDHDVDCFEYATGMKLTDIPLVDSDAALKKPHKKIIRCPVPFGIVWKDNPKWNEAEARAAAAAKKIYGVPKRLFVRYEKERGSTAKPEANGEHGSGPAVDAGKLLAKWKEFVSSEPPLEAFEDFRTDPANMPDGDEWKELRVRIWSGIKAYAKAAEWKWDERNAKFVESQIPF